MWSKCRPEIIKQVSEVITGSGDYFRKIILLRSLDVHTAEAAGTRSVGSLCVSKLHVWAANQEPGKEVWKTEFLISNAANLEQTEKVHVWPQDKRVTTWLRYIFKMIFVWWIFLKPWMPKVIFIFPMHIHSILLDTKYYFQQLFLQHSVSTRPFS